MGPDAARGPVVSVRRSVYEEKGIPTDPDNDRCARQADGDTDVHAAADPRTLFAVVDRRSKQNAHAENVAPRFRGPTETQDGKSRVRISRTVAERD